MNRLDYVESAEKIIKDLKESEGKIKISTNQIRNLLTMTNELYNMAQRDRNPKLSEEVQSHIQYIKMKFVYEAGRDKGVKNFIERSKMLKYFNQIGNNRKALMLICHYMEALVAYHRFYSEEEN